VLVDEGTVLLENIHVHLEAREARADAVLAASREVATPRLLAMLSVFSVFLPSFFMTGPAQALFLPLSLAVGFSMGASYLLSSTLVPVLANWMLRGAHPTGPVASASASAKKSAFARFRNHFQGVLTRAMRHPVLLVGGYALAAASILALVAPRLAQEVFPSSASKQFRLRIDAPDGTRVAVTEDDVRRALAAITQEAGEENLDLSLGYVGTQGSSYPINAVFLWTSGPQQALINIGLKQDSRLDLRELEERLRTKLSHDFPDLRFSFDPGDLISQILNFGAPSQVEVAVTGPQYADAQAYAQRVRDQLAKVNVLRDVEFEEPLHYPTVSVKIDRMLAGQLGATANDAAAAVVSSTASSRFIAANFWRDPKSGVSYQVQVEVPQPQMTSMEDIANIPVSSTTGAFPLLRQLATLEPTTVPGELDRKNGLWMLALSANVANNDLGGAANGIDRALKEIGAAPRGVTVEVRGQVSALHKIFGELAIGLAAAIGVILLLLTANFQSLRLALIVVSTTPAVLVGVVLALFVTGTSVNLESFMGTIMAIGVAVANAILLVTFAEQGRRNGADSHEAARAAATERLRPVLMTSLAMIAGMIPMALAVGQGSEETAPLGRAVIGGLAVATLATLFLLPTIFGIVQRAAPTVSPSLDPEDPESRFSRRAEAPL
jgi:multidrug efflux pump subunit AcrB